MHLTIKVQGLDNGHFVAYVPELPGVQCERDTPPQAIHHVKGVALQMLAELIEQQAIQLDGLVFHLEVTRQDVDQSPAVDVVMDAIAKVRARYPDFDEFQSEAHRMGQRFRACQVGADAIDIEEYLDGLYLLARFSRFSRAPGASPDAAWMLAQQKGEVQKKPAVQ